jgi:hypothetical protein
MKAWWIGAAVVPLVWVVALLHATVHEVRSLRSLHAGGRIRFFSTTGEYMFRGVIISAGEHSLAFYQWADDSNGRLVYNVQIKDEGLTWIRGWYSRSRRRAALAARALRFGGDTA